MSNLVTLGNKPILFGLIDSGANVHIVTSQLAEYLNLPINKFNQPVVISTAKEDSTIPATGYIKLGGYIGDMVVVPKAAQNLLSTSLLQDHGLTVTFHANGTCELSTKRTKLLLSKDVKTGLFYLNIAEFIISPLNKDCTFYHQPLYLINNQEQWDGSYDFNTLIARAGKKIIQRPGIKAISQEKVLMVRQLHKNLGHANYRTLALAIRDGIIRNVDITFTEMMTVAANTDCEACANAKCTQVPKSLGSGIRNDIPFHTISIDKLGPYTPAAYGNYSYALIAIDTSTMFGIVHLYRNVKANHYIQFVDKIRLFALRYHFNIKRIRCDAGSIENANVLDTHLASHGIEICPAVPEHQNQNPVERYIRTIKDTVAAMMYNQVIITPEFWGMSLIMAVAIRNMLPNSRFLRRYLRQHPISKLWG